MNPPAIEMCEVSKRYAGVTALDRVDLAIGQGELVGLVGPSGSGKSTMLHLAGTLDRPTSGRISIDGARVDTMPDNALSALRANSIGFVFQQFHLAAGVSALENVADGLLYAGVKRRERLARAAEALHAVGLSPRLDHMPHQLSGGERQRVAIARAVVRRPVLLLADEPTGNLDSASGESILQLLIGLHTGGTTVVVITHDRHIADRLPRQVELRDGRIVHDTAVRDNALEVAS